MINRILALLIVGAAGYWYWSEHYRAGGQPGYEEQLLGNAGAMQKCLRGKAYKAGSTGEGSGNPETQCAQQYNLYLYKGRWYNYDQVRRED